MNSLVFYLGSASLYAAGAVCLRHTRRYSRAGGDGYLRRDRRRQFATILLTAATMCLALALMIQYIDSSR